MRQKGMLFKQILGLLFIGEMFLGSAAIAIAADTYFDDGSQWYLKNYNPEEPNFGIDVQKAWKLYAAKGNSDVIVAVLDSGVTTVKDYVCPLNPDRFSTKAPEFYGFNGFGGTSFVPGWNFVNESHAPADFYGHGTWVSTIIAAQHDNEGCHINSNHNPHLSGKILSNLCGYKGIAPARAV